jgi:hypothetical protein
MIPESFLFCCISSLVYEFKRLSQALCWPLALKGCPPSHFQDLPSLKTCCLRCCIFYERAENSHTQCIHCPFLSYSHSQHSCHSLCPSLYRWTLRVLWPVNSPTAALSLNLLISRSSLALPGRGYLISILDCRQPVQAAHLCWCFSCKCFLMRF